MSRSLLIPEDLYSYVEAAWLREPNVLKRLRDETQAMPEGRMQIGADQGQLMALMVRLIGAKRTLEVGVFTGYSSLVTALALPDDGQIVACDVSEEFTNVARRYWTEAGVAEKIDLRLGPAIETLDWLIAQGMQEEFDFAFIDADKANYLAYYERALQLVKQNGLIAIDNVLWGGRVIDQAVDDEDTQAIRELNRVLHEDDRVDLALVPIGDGLTFARKR
jgi:predicted O-methyltransferase YrrM